MVKLLIISFAMVACLAGDALLGKEFLLRKDETATVKNTDMSVKVITAGRMQSGSAGDMVYCQVQITHAGRSETRDILVGKSISNSGLNVKVVSVDLKVDTKLDDPWQNIACSFVVTKAEK